MPKIPQWTQHWICLVKARTSTMFTLYASIQGELEWPLRGKRGPQNLFRPMFGSDPSIGSIHWGAVTVKPSSKFTLNAGRSALIQRIQLGMLLWKILVSTSMRCSRELLLGIPLDFPDTRSQRRDYQQGGAKGSKKSGRSSRIELQLPFVFASTQKHVKSPSLKELHSSIVNSVRNSFQMPIFQPHYNVNWISTWLE